MPDAITVSGVRRAFDDGTVALDGTTLSVERGSVAVLVGPSGCGKTTLLRILAGLDAPDAGTASVAPVAGEGAARVSIAFQEPRLLPWRSALRNVALPLELARAAKADRDDRARAMLSLVGLGGAERKLPGQLSGGMRMRVAIARALVTRPQVLLLDEPFGALDEITRHQLDDLVLRLRAELGMTVVLVTHAITEAAYMGDRVFVMAPSPGRVVRAFEPGFGTRDAALRASPRFAAVVADLMQSLAGAMLAVPAGGVRA
ncbi:MAG: ABC transporter ATP-binding protein [Phycisphaerales bacterium]